MQRGSLGVTLGTFAATLAFVLAAGTSAAQAAGNENPEIIPPHAMPHGMSYGEWGAAWWQWMLSVPALQNPNLDETGANAAAGQSGPVWFLAGNFGGSSERTIDVPHGKTLFFPVVNFLVTSVICVDPDEDVPVEAMVDYAAATIDAATGVYVEIDGVPVQDPTSYRGAWDSLLAPMKTGEHTIRFGGELPSVNFSLDVTYHITVS